MHWKNWPYWLRGGVIGVGIILISFMLGEICEYRISHIPNYGGLGLECLPFALPWMSLWFVLFQFPDFPLLYLNVIVFVVWFLIGSLIGGIVGKVKKKKSPLA